MDEESDVSVNANNSIRMRDELSALLRQWIEDGLEPSQASVEMTVMGFVAGLMAGLRPQDMAVAVPDLMKNAQITLGMADEYRKRAL